MRDLLQEMRSDTHPSAALLWQDLCACFAPIGVRILRHGEIPEDGKTAYVLVTALREAITNAVRHAHARQIDARFFRDGPYCCMAVTNDGPPPEAVVEGNGLGGIRQSVERLGGSMRINCTPRFTLIVCLPEGSDV